jgi:hypothetical protein
MNLCDLFVVEWSEKQSAFQVSTVDSMLEANIECYLHVSSPEDSDWMVVGISQTHEGAHQQLENLKKMMDGKKPV